MDFDKGSAGSIGDFGDDNPQAKMMGAGIDNDIQSVQAAKVKKGGKKKMTKQHTQKSMTAAEAARGAMGA